MSRGLVGALLATFVLGLLAAVVLFPGASRSQGTGTPVETMTIPGDDSVIQSATEFLTDHTYKLVFSGTTHKDAFSFDALYCYAGCNPPSRGNEMQLGIGGTSWALDDFRNNGVRESIPLDSNFHEYTIDGYHPPGRGHLFVKSHLISGAASTRSGEYTIKIFDITPAPPPPTDTGGGGMTQPTNTGGTTNTGGSNLPGADQPAPGEGTAFPGQPVTGTQTAGIVTLGGGLGGSIVVGEGSKTKKQRSKQETTNVLIECFLISDHPLEVLAGEDFPGTDTEIEEFLRDPNAAAFVFRFCFNLLVKQADALTKSQPGAQSGRASATGGCNSKRIVISARKKKGTKKLKVKLVKSKLPKKTVRYTCLPNKDGKLQFKVDGRKKGGLKKHLGSKLELGLIRPPKLGPKTGRIDLAFKKT